MRQKNPLDNKEDLTKKIRILAVDDHELVRNGMAFLFSPFDDIEIVGTAHSGEEALRLCEKYQPNVVLMDMLLPGMDGAETTQAIRSQNPQVQVLALTSFHDQELVSRTMRAGAIGYLLKGVSIDDLAEGIRSAHIGKPVMSMEAVQDLTLAAQSGSKPSGDLSPRELEVLSLLADGKSNKNIANTLHISLPTTKSHVSSILSKLGVSNRAEAALVAVKENLVPY